MTIELIPADVAEEAGDSSVGEPPVSAGETPPEESAVAEETVPPVKRGRGRPAGSKNRAKVATAPLPAPRPAPIVTAPQPAPVEEPPPPPKPVERRPRAPRKPREYVEEEPESPPETPRSYRAWIHREYKEIRVNQHAERRNRFCSKLNRLMH